MRLRRGFSCFNEAGARTPQKCAGTRGRLRRCRRFNEAGARTPQKRAALQPRQMRPPASMRLGRERPRKPRRKRRPGACSTLQ